MFINRWLDKSWCIPTMLLTWQWKEPTTNIWNMGESQRHGCCVKEASEWFCTFPLCDISGEAKLVYSEIKQISGSWSWRGITGEGNKGTSFWDNECSLSWLDRSHWCLQTMHLKWVHIMDVKSRSKKLIYKGEKAGLKHFNFSNWPSC